MQLADAGLAHAELVGDVEELGAAPVMQAHDASEPRRQARRGREDELAIDVSDRLLFGRGPRVRQIGLEVRPDIVVANDDGRARMLSVGTHAAGAPRQPVLRAQPVDDGAANATAQVPLALVGERVLATLAELADPVGEAFERRLLQVFSKDVPR